MPDVGIVFKNTDGLIVKPEVVVSDVHVIVCSDELPRSPATGAESVDTEIDVMLFVPAATVRAADAGTVDNTPRPKAATATSAMRLKVVFVDICFLSISRSEEFPPLGLGGKCLLICHERALFERSRVFEVIVSTLSECKRN
jgi:hypothetical protein